MASAEVAEKLNLEAEILAKLDHPNIVKFLTVSLDYMGSCMTRDRTTLS